MILYELIYHNKQDTVTELRKANKIIKKAKENKTTIKHSVIAPFEDLKSLAVSDGSYCKLDNKEKSVSGRFIFLSNVDESKVSPLMWKSKTIAQVCQSLKAAETRSLSKTVYDAVPCSRAVHEIHTGERGEKQIPVTCVTDSQSLLDSISSTKQIDEKLLRPQIAA